VRTLAEIHTDIEAASARRAELWKALGEAYDPALAAELRRLNDRVAALWDEHRTARAQLRFGDRGRIVARARAEERLERAA
jgi:uncharacterized protein YPO0396